MPCCYAIVTRCRRRTPTAAKRPNESDAGSPPGPPGKAGPKRMAQCGKRRLQRYDAEQREAVLETRRGRAGARGQCLPGATRTPMVGSPRLNCCRARRGAAVDRGRLAHGRPGKWGRQTAGHLFAGFRRAAAQASRFRRLELAQQGPRGEPMVTHTVRQFQEISIDRVSVQSEEMRGHTARLDAKIDRK